MGLGIAQARTLGQLVVEHHPPLPLRDERADRANGQYLTFSPSLCGHGPISPSALATAPAGQQARWQLLLIGFDRSGLHRLIDRAGALGQTSYRSPPRRSSLYSTPALPAQRTTKP